MAWWGRAGAETGDGPARREAWEVALSRHDVPPFVAERLSAAAAGKTPWIATMTPAELRLNRSHGVRPLAMVSGTCWYHFGWSWTEGHEAGWHAALDRIRSEARACGANAVVDVKLRTIRTRIGASMDFTLVGTAVRIDRLPPSTDPVIATVPALEFMRLVESGIVPVGLGVGAAYRWITDRWGGMAGWAFTSQPLHDLGAFWNDVRREAHADLRRRTAAQGNGVLAHTHYGALIQRERDKQPTQYLGRHIVIGTVVEVERGARDAPDIRPVVDMRGAGQSERAFHDIDYGASDESEEAI